MKPLLARAAAVVGVAVTLRAVFDAWFLNYDARYALLWARDFLRGVTPDFEAAFAPTPHPLSIAWSLPGSETLIVWGTLLAFGLVVVLVHQLGSDLFSPWVGLIAALVVLTRPAMLRDALLGYQDVAFAVLVLVAVLLEARRPRRGTAVLLVLAVAGLLRPEAWVLAGLYWLYLAPSSSWSQRARSAVLVALAPVCWSLVDLAVTGDALHSLHGTTELAELNERRRDLIDAPYWTAKYYGFALREPLILAVPVGMAFAYRHRERFGRPAVLLLAAVAAMTAVFMAGPVLGLPLVARYVRTPSVLLAIFAGLALAGWLLVHGRERRIWQGLAALTAAAFLAFAPANARLISGLEARFDRDGRFYADLREVARNDMVRQGVGHCGPLVAADHRPVAHLRYWLDGDPGTVLSGEVAEDPQRLLLAPRRTRRAEAFFRENFPELEPSADAVPLYGNATWTVTTTGC